MVFSTNPRLQFFTLVSIPVSQSYNSIDDRQQFRFGAGTIIMLGRAAELVK
jgi:hypothetical protein